MRGNKKTTNPVTCEQICSCLASVGVRPGMAIVVHGSLKSFGYVEGGPQTVIEALIKTVGSEGLIIMPVYAASFDQKGELLRSPSPRERISTGQIAAAFGQDSRTILASHPMYAYAFYGRDARKLARKAEVLLMPYGSGQPLAGLFPRRGYIVQIGVDDRTNTSIHVAEEFAEPPYLTEKKSVSHISVKDYFLLPLEIRREMLTLHRAGPRRDFSISTSLIEKAGLRKTAIVGTATVMATDFSGMCELLIDKIRKNANMMMK